VVRALEIRAHDRRVIAWAVRLGPWAAGAEADRWLATATRHDPSGLCADLRRLVARAGGSAADDPRDPARIVALGWRVTRQRSAGVPVTRAWRNALAEPSGLDDEIVRRIADQVRTRRHPAP
jgi:hypothetical protein